MKLTDLKVLIYFQDLDKVPRGHRIDTRFEDELRDLLKKYGWRWSGQGTDLENGVRDISFVRRGVASQKGQKHV